MKLGARRPTRVGQLKSMKRNLIYHTHIPVNNTVTTKTERGQYTTELGCLSRDGMVLTCNRNTLDKMFPNTVSIAPRQPKKIVAAFTLPGDTKLIETACEVYSLRRLSRDLFELTMKYDDLSEEDYELVDQYVESKLKSLNHDLNRAA
jgi:c-di-GMP-binding flagellar brake protein YcgR